MKVNDFVECSEVASMDHVARLGRVTKVEGYAVHVTLFNGAHLIVDKGYVSPAPLLDVWRSIEEEIAKVEARAADRVRDLRGETRTLFDRALSDRK